MQERLPIPQYDCYFADIYGQIWSNKFNKWRQLKASPLHHGYLQVMVKKNGEKCRPVKVAFLVARAFFGARPEGKQICHNNGNNQDNRPINLRYDTAKGNARDRIKHNKRLQKNKLQISLFATV